jgi:hypothetical protein
VLALCFSPSRKTFRASDSEGTFHLDPFSAQLVVYIQWRTLLGLSRSKVSSLHGYDDDRDAEAVDICQACLSGNQSEFSTEICIHFPGGLESLDKPAVIVYPKIVVCLNCGHTEFPMLETALRALVDGRLLAVGNKGLSSAA